MVKTQPSLALWIFAQRGLKIFQEFVKRYVEMEYYLYYNVMMETYKMVMDAIHNVLFKLIILVLMVLLQLLPYVVITNRYNLIYYHQLKISQLILWFFKYQFGQLLKY